MKNNQCDGCQAGKPLVNGTHRMGREGGYPDAMGCQKHRYAVCHPRKRFATRQSADAACSSLVKRGGPLRLPETCQHCNGWHLSGGIK